MLAFWPDVIRPILEELQPTDVVEIGSEEGKTTRHLLEFARQTDARIHCIDPSPCFDVDSWTMEFEHHFSFIELPSLVGLPSVEQFDVVLIDGDHNWYTVFNELLLIERLSTQIGQTLPLVFLHDIGWPYGRRDLYYNPSTIPEQHRHPYARKGISPTAARVVPSGGFNAKLCNAIEEGGPKNGVLTAVEDYLQATEHSFEFVRIPAVFGLGILMPERLVETRPKVAQKVRAWAPQEVEKFIDRLEMARIAMLTGIAR